MLATIFQGIQRAVFAILLQPYPSKHEGVALTRVAIKFIEFAQIYNVEDGGTIRYAKI